MISTLERITTIRKKSNAFLQFQLTLGKDGGHFEDDNRDSIRLVKNALAHVFKETTILTTAENKLEQNNYVGPVST